MALLHSTKSRIRLGVSSWRNCKVVTAARSRVGAAHFASRTASLAEQLRGGGSVLEDARPQRPSNAPAASSRSRLVSADRNFLVAGGGQVLLHDYRDMKFLKQATAVGVFGTLMSSSGLVYAISMEFSTAACGGFFFQTAGAALFLAGYMRSYVARATLDPRRARLVLTGCGLFGEALTSEQDLPLALIKPGATINEHYIRFRLQGSVLNPACWFPYRIPRAPMDAAQRKTGAQVGFRTAAAAAAAPAAAPAPVAPAAGRESPAGAGKSGQKRFLGAGLGAGRGTQRSSGAFGGDDDGLPRSVAAPALPSMGGATEDSQGVEEAAPVLNKSLADLRLQHGLPLNAAEEQKIIDFLEEPAAYAAVGLRVL